MHLFRFFSSFCKVFFFVTVINFACYYSSNYQHAVSMIFYYQVSNVKSGDCPGHYSNRHRADRQLELVEEGCCVKTVPRGEG